MPAVMVMMAYRNHNLCIRWRVTSSQNKQHHQSH
jgi:hypothetical protein